MLSKFLKILGGICVVVVVMGFVQKQAAAQAKPDFEVVMLVIYNLGIF